MTTPNLPWGATTQSDLGEGVIMPSGLGSALQDQSHGKFLALASGRFPGVVSGTSAGSPSAPADPLGFVVDLAAKFLSTVANADPASITRPEDLHDLVTDFVDGLPLVGELIDLKDAMLGEYTGDDPVFLLIQNLFAPLRKVLQLVSGQSGIPTVGEITSGWSSLWDDLEANFEELKDALDGSYAGSDPALVAIQQIARGFRSVLSGGGLFNLGQLTTAPVNLLPSGGFDTDGTVAAGEGWSHDPAVGRTAPGSARFDGTGDAGLLFSPAPAEVEPGKAYTARCFVSWDGVVASGAAFTPFVRWSDSAGAVLSETALPTVSSPPSSSSWVELAAEVTAPANARWAHLAFRVESGVAGTVWWDDAGLWADQETLPQSIISGLTAALSQLGEDVEAALGRLKDLIERLTGQARATLTEAIEDALAFGTQLKTILSGGSVGSPLPNLAGATISQIKTMLQQIADILNGLVVTPINSAVSGVADWFAGLLGWQSTTTANAAATQEAVSNVGTQVDYVQQVIAVRSGVGIWESGPDPTGVVSFPFSMLMLHSHTTESGSIGMAVPTINATSAWAPWATVRFASATERRVLTYMASKTGTVAGFYLDVYRQEIDGSATLLWSSADQAPSIGGALAWQTLLIDTPIPVDIGDVLEVQFRMGGTGSVAVAGINLPYPTPISGFRPYAPGAGRKPSPAAPATIATATRDGMYQGNVPFLSIGIDVGQTQIPRYFYDYFNRTSFGARWSVWNAIKLDGSAATHSGGWLDSGTGTATYSQPLLADAAVAEFDVSSDDGAVGVGICGASGMSFAAWATVTDSTAAIQTGSATSRTTRASASGGSGRYRLTYTPADQTYRLSRGGTKIVSWADTGAVVAHGAGRRWVGVMVTKTELQTAGRLNNWTAADVVS